MKCPNCGTDYQGNFCPNCGTAPQNTQQHPQQFQQPQQQPQQFQQQPPKKKGGALKVVLIVLAVLVAIGILGTVFGNEGDSNPSNSSAASGSSQTSISSQETKKENLEVLEHSMTEDEYYSYVVGKIQNNSDKTYSYVQVSINLYNGETQVGSTLDNVNNLEPGGNWEIKALITDPSITSYKIVEVTGL